MCEIGEEMATDLRIAGLERELLSFCVEEVFGEIQEWIEAGEAALWLEVR